MELCWLTTGWCNQKCNYCDRFQSVDNLTEEQYFIILDKLIKYGVKKLTFGGGESLMVDCFGEIVEKAHRNGMYLKLVTNGELVPQNKNLMKKFDEITLSIDSSDAEMNEKLGRGINHMNNICTAIELIRQVKKESIININSVVTQINIKDVLKLSDQIEKWDVNEWRIFRFTPLRERAVKNRDSYEISNEQFLGIKEAINNVKLACKVQFRNYTDMENGYLLINPFGQLCVSQGMKDVIVGDMLKDDLKSKF